MFKINLHVHHHLDQAFQRWLERELKALTTNQEKTIMLIDDLKANVAKNTDAVASAVTLLGNLKTQLDAAIASGDPAQLQALSDTLGKNDSDLAAAVTANTPAAPTA